jgi:hypothetical protein
MERGKPLSFADVLGPYVPPTKPVAREPDPAPRRAPVPVSDRPRPWQIVSPAKPQFRNRRAAACAKCGVWLPVDQGYIQKEEDGWQVYCSLDHAGQVTAPAATRRPLRPARSSPNAPRTR